MIKIIHRYLAVSFIPPFLLSSAFFVLFLLTTQMFKVIRVVISKGVDPSLIFKLMFDIGVSFVPLAVPISIFFATIYCISKLSEDSEIIAMRSFGLGKNKILLPLMCVALMIAITTFALNWNVVPKANQKFTNTLLQLTSKGILNNIRPGEFFTEIPNVILFADKVSDEGKKLKNVFIQITNKKKTETKVMMAAEGNLIKKKAQGSNITFLNLLLRDGNIITSFKKNSDLEKVLFKSYDFPLFSNKSMPGTLSRSAMLDSNTLYKKIEQDRTRLKKIKVKKKLSRKDKRNLVDLPREIARDLMELYTRINTPLLSLIFVFLGFSLGVSKGRGENRSTGAIGLAILIIYYILFFTGVSLIKKYSSNVMLIVFTPSAIMLMIGYYFYSKVDWND